LGRSRRGLFLAIFGGKIPPSCQKKTKRRQVVYEVQRQLAKKMYAVYSPGMGSIFLVAWPCIGNYRVWWDGRMNESYWIDETKAPFV
jgi:hypothetical protein